MRSEATAAPGSLGASSGPAPYGSHLRLFGQSDGFYLKFLQMRSTYSHGDTSLGIRLRNTAHIILFEVSTSSERIKGVPFVEIVSLP
jgi:hypothetical protein